MSWRTNIGSSYTKGPEGSTVLYGVQSLRYLCVMANDDGRKQRRSTQDGIDQRLSVCCMYSVAEKVFYAAGAATAAFGSDIMACRYGYQVPRTLQLADWATNTSPSDIMAENSWRRRVSSGREWCSADRVCRDPSVHPHNLPHSLMSFARKM